MFMRSLAITMLFACPANAADPSDVWLRHLEAASTGNIDAVMADFDDQSAIVTPEGTITGREGVRAFFEEALQGVTPDVAESIVVNAFHAHEGVVFFNATLPSLGITLHDVAVIEGEKIRTLTTLTYPVQ